MDKFHIATEAIVANAAPHEQAEVRAIMQVIADLGRDFEQFCADVERIAIAVERLAGKMNTGES